MKNLSKEIDEALAKHFRPEFLNRVDEVIKFLPLTTEDLQKIVRLHLNDLTKLLSEQGLTLSFDPEIIESLASQGYEPEYGARPLRRVIRRQLENPLATELLEENFDGVRSVRVTRSNEEQSALTFIAEN